MQFIKASIVKTVILSAAFSLVSTCAHAATVKVNLPVEARWGGVILTPGEYTVSTSENSPAIKVSGVGKAVTILVQSTDDTKSGAPSEFYLVDVNGTPTINAFQSSVTGKTYRFHVKTADQSQMAKLQKHQNTVAAAADMNSAPGTP